MENKFTEQQSLAIINEMIAQARNNFQKGSGTSMIYNGCMVAFAALLNIVLIFVLPNPNQSFWIWCLMIPSMAVSRLIGRKVDKKAMVKTHIDKIIITTWRSFGWAVALFLIVIFGYEYRMQNIRMFILITPIIMIMAGLAELITAKACRFKPFFVGGLIMWGGALACLLGYVFLRSYSGILQFAILALCMLLSFAIPGYQLNKKAKENV